MKTFCRSLALLLASAGAVAGAGPYTDLFVFGDSLSDVGNTDAATFGFVPGSGYDDGRFSNGPLYSERLSEGLGLGTLRRSGAGGRNFAYGGAETDGPRGLEGLFLDSLVEQVDEFVDRLGSTTPSPDALFVVFIGANDLFAGQTNVATPTTTILNQMSRLAARGAKNFLGINLPRLGLTPDFNGDAAAADTINETTTLFNDALEEAYGTLETNDPDVTVHRLDVESLFNGLVAEPSRWGFLNATDPGRDVRVGLEAPGYAFWDGVHPTRAAHALLGDAALRAVLPAGDYNRDGAVTSDDYGVWSAGFGNRFDAAAGVIDGMAADGNGDGVVDGADYTLWRDAAMAAGLALVPEPAGAAALAIGLLGMLGCGGFRQPAR